MLLRILYQLNAYDFSTLDRDLLGDLYQKLLPRDLRKKMGEFYTDEEVVEYILHRSGYVQACRDGAPSLLDPACGSGSFLVRAAAYLIEGARARGVGDAGVLELVSRCIHGLDINDFAVFIARVNLLFTVFDLIARTRRDVVFQVHEANSLMGVTEIDQLATAFGEGAVALPAMTDGERARQGRYDFVVGNPPYVRAERIPDQDRAAIQHAYNRIAEHNVDLAGYFVYRGMGWLAEDGVFSMIVPRAIADAGYAGALRGVLSSGPISVTELTPLDWACHDLFDSDTVPVILQYRRRAAGRDHEVALVQGLRSRAEIAAATDTVAAAQHLPWSAFAARAEEETWPLEATPDDMRVRDFLGHFESLGRDGGPVSTRFGAKLGARCTAHDAATTGEAPLLTGSEVFPFWHGPARRFAAVRNAAGPSLWAAAFWNDATRQFEWSELHSGREPMVTACAKIGVTLNACLLDRTRFACQDTVVLAEWRDASAPPGVLTALLNSALLRWYSFIFARAGVAGGGRRDYSIYPRTLDALPCPALQASWTERLADLVDGATRVAIGAAPLDPELWGEIVLTAGLTQPLAAWPIDWMGWPGDIGLGPTTLCVDREEPGRLRLTRSIVLASSDPQMLDFLQIHLPIVVAAAGRLQRAEVQGVVVPAHASVRGILARYRDSIEARDRARDEYLQVLDEIDEAVYDAFAMPDDLRAIVRQRMTEFPLNENAANPRKPWEPTRKPKIKLFEPGERYH